MYLYVCGEGARIVLVLCSRHVASFAATTGRRES